MSGFGEMVVAQSQGSVYGSAELDDFYRPLPFIYFGLLVIWVVLASYWIINAKRNSYLEPNHLQWTLAFTPVIKALQVFQAFLFWYSCLNRRICSIWMSYGVYVTGVLFQTASLVSFLLISHGYSIVCENLSVSERRTTAALGSALYLILVGYRASVPFFTVLLWVNYSVSFYVIFRHISQNLLVLREQMNTVEDENIQIMRDSICSKYLMFKKFQNAMQVLAMAQFMIHINLNSVIDNHWLTFLVHEWVQLCILLHVGYVTSHIFVCINWPSKRRQRTGFCTTAGWTFWSPEPAPRFSLVHEVEPEEHSTMPPIYSLEMDVNDFKDMSLNEWHIGVQTSSPQRSTGKSSSPLLIVVQHPRALNNPGQQGPTTTKAIAASIISSDSCWQSNRGQTLSK
ncbi:hypothetical protein H6P81_009137 [Aristolochia fimbriata]|uniref:Transmembrane protein n=1 Tax=Aristolochia fimbriata TaxID=158543 RepID=A0AAV7ENH2_ARIFI|nr:hypothetical protein H6P81_009137 [Aristolochia fimbriata]